MPNCTTASTTSCRRRIRAKVVIVSPSLLMLAIHVIQQIQRDARMREAADKIHAEVGHLMDDIERLHDRVLNLQQHFGQANEDVRQILISAEKVEKRAARIREVEFDGEDGRRPIRSSSPRRCAQAAGGGIATRRSRASPSPSQFCLSPSSAMKRFASAICSSANFW